MSAQTIAFAQHKGGVGKTTLTIHLACLLMARNKSVALIDLDPQGSLSFWHRERQGENEAPVAPLLQAAPIDKARATLTRLKKQAEFVLIDCPPQGEKELRFAARAADLVVLPLQLSPVDLWATMPTLETIGRAKGDVLLVANRVPPRSRMADDLLARLKKERLPLARTALGNRVAYAASLAAGQGVNEFEPGGPAAAEIAALWRDVSRRLKQVAGR